MHKTGEYAETVECVYGVKAGCELGACRKGDPGIVIRAVLTTIGTELHLDRYLLAGTRLAPNGSGKSKKRTGAPLA